MIVFALVKQLCNIFSFTSKYYADIAIELPEIIIKPVMPEIVCANEEPAVECREDLCIGSVCAAFPSAVCKIDACGICSTVFTNLLTGFAEDCGKQTRK